MATSSAVVTTEALLEAIRRHDAGGTARLMRGGTLALEPLEVTIDDPADLEALFADVFSALPDLTVQAVRTFAGSDQLAVELVVNGTLTGALRGAPPTGRAAELFGRAVIDLTDDRKCISLYFDRATAFEQLGLSSGSSAAARSDGSALRAALASEPWWDQHPQPEVAPGVAAAPAVAASMPPPPMPSPPSAAVAEATTGSARTAQATLIRPSASTFVLPTFVEPEVEHPRRAKRLGLIAVAVLGVAAVAGGIALVVARDAQPSSPSQAGSVPAATAPAVQPSPLGSPTTNLPAVVLPAAPASNTWHSAKLFDIGSTQLRPGAATTLAALAQRIRAARHSGTVTVTGYTDDVGSPRLNVALSAQRAAVVGAALRGDLTGTKWKVKTVGAGAAHPVAPNTTYANQAKNRRIEVAYPTS